MDNRKYELYEIMEGDLDTLPSLPNITPQDTWDYRKRLAQYLFGRGLVNTLLVDKHGQFMPFIMYGYDLEPRLLFYYMDFIALSYRENEDSRIPLMFEELFRYVEAKHPNIIFEMDLSKVHEGFRTFVYENVIPEYIEYLWKEGKINIDNIDDPKYIKDTRSWFIAIMNIARYELDKGNKGMIHKLMAKVKETEERSGFIFEFYNDIFFTGDDKELIRYGIENTIKYDKTTDLDLQNYDILHQAYSYGQLDIVLDVLKEMNYNVVGSLGRMFQYDRLIENDKIILSKVAEKYGFEGIKNKLGNNAIFKEWYDDIVLNQV